MEALLNQASIYEAGLLATSLSPKTDAASYDLDNLKCRGELKYGYFGISSTISCLLNLMAVKVKVDCITFVN